MDLYPERKIDEFRLELDAAHDVLYYPLNGENEISKPHSHNFLLLVLFETGSGVHSIDFINYDIRPKQLHILFPDQVHSWKLDANSKVHQLMVDSKVFDIIGNAFRFGFALYRKHPVFDLEQADYDKLLHEFLTVRNNLDEVPVLLDLVVARMYVVILMMSQIGERVFDNLTVFLKQPILTDYLALIDKHFLEERSVSFYAAQLNITANYLNVLCKKHFFCKATDMIDERVLLETKRLLISGHTIKDTAYKLEFSDVAYFSRYFKLKTGLTPKEFKDQYSCS
ncbi:MAG: helix-turn-helix domain-containing protein [Chitinophaga sp.]|uniref:helix-turn-helix transcriptional regulator n=1 Tax=Chitinophaga sp. TaxID=1869181 RepID=UPI0025BD413B|nr:helix-turn-helix transcriptional regulator [Chitinophaga sp.]MBV8251423.1 helix-turn-helix domain-containing protein [Chitinophaga sp.]